MKTAVQTVRALRSRSQDENPEGREALRELIQRMREERRAAYIFVNNRFEGNAPETIQAVVEERILDRSCPIDDLLPEIVERCASSIW